MERAGFPTQQIEETLVKLIGWRYLDDRAFARAFALSAVEHKRWGPARVEVGAASARSQRGAHRGGIERRHFPKEKMRLSSEPSRASDAPVAAGERPSKKKARAFRHLERTGIQLRRRYGRLLDKDNAGQETDS